METTTPRTGRMETTTPRTRTERAAARRAERARRHQIAAGVAHRHGGVARLADLTGAGLTRGEIRSEIEAGVWKKVGVHTVDVAGGAPSERGLWWRALWESGVTAVLDGAAALVAAGLTGWTPEVIDVSVPNGCGPRAVPGVRHHRLRQLGPRVTHGLPRTKPHVAALRAAQWAASDRAAATLIAMAVQQGVASPTALLERRRRTTYSPRRDLLDVVVLDVCDGARSMSELDFARACRNRGIPEPTRQAPRQGRTGSVYLDVLWEELGVHAEIHGAQHYVGLAVVDDTLRSNEVQIRKDAEISLQIPVLGFRLDPDAYLRQVEEALRMAAHRRARVGGHRG